MEKLKVMTVVGTRPEIIRLSKVIEELENSESILHLLVHTGQNYDYELSQIFFEELKIKRPDYFLEAASQSASKTIGNIIIKIDELFELLRPDALLILGDTNSCLCAIPAKKRKIPIFHMEAGNRCFDQRVPEETNRKIVDHISDINLTYSQIAREYLISEGIAKDRIIKTGSPMFEVLNSYIPQIEASNILVKLNLVKRKYFLVSSHREENIDNEENFFKLIKCLNELAQLYNFPIIVSAHPRTHNMIKKRSVILDPLIKLLKPVGFIDYNSLQKNSFVVLSDSGTISEESSILNFRALNIREAHERPEAMEEASVMMVGLNIDRILQAILILERQEVDNRNIRIVEEYSMPNVSKKVVRIILSYVDYVKRVVWSRIH